ncbi:RNA-directed DNA polymerase, eukaryota, reverse transcriptase zinc-binding domain protein [Tanacetum coccineum]
MGVNVEDGMVKNAASKLGCLVLKTPFTYLGTKVGGNMSRKQAWKEVVDKVLSRLSRWKMKLLSIGGRLTLLKSVLGSMPIFHMSIFKVPSSILKSLESIRSRFFNGQDPKSNKASWVKWNKVLTPKDKGGLGVSSLFALNRGLMLKWVWRFYSQKCSLWTKVIKAIYGEDGNLNKDVSGGVRTCWTSIVHEVRVLQGRGINVADYILLKLGNERTRSSGRQLTLESDGVFSVASIRKEIDGNRFQDVSLPTRWVKSVPIKGKMIGLHGIIVVGTPAKTPCCSLLGDLVDLEAAVCLCTAIKANVLGINLNVPVDLSLLLNYCGKKGMNEDPCASNARDKDVWLQIANHDFAKGRDVIGKEVEMVESRVGTLSQKNSDVGISICLVAGMGDMTMEGSYLGRWAPLYGHSGWVSSSVFICHSKLEHVSSQKLIGKLFFSAKDIFGFVVEGLNWLGLGGRFVSLENYIVMATSMNVHNRL